MPPTPPNPPWPKQLTLPELRERMMPFFQEFQKYQDREAAIVGAAWIEDFVQELLRARLVDDRDAVDWAFDNGALRSARAKIEMAYLTGVIGPRQHECFVAVNDIRNRFAHAHQVTSFEQPEVLGLTKRLMPADVDRLFPNITGTSTEGRDRFVSAVLMQVIILTGQDAFFERLKLGPVTAPFAP